MATMEALLKIRADVEGEGAIGGLSRALNNVENTAEKVSGGLRNMTAAAGMNGLAGAMGALMPMLSVAGLTALAKNALDAGASMYDMAQKTGISVESLAKFKKAASTSGTDLESVARASQKLSKGLYDAATTGKGPAASALATLGISAKDAAGKVRNADAVMLDIATKFKSMPDGAAKTALAIQLFGRAGADMIPMLNMGGDAIDRLSSKMTTAFAQKADQYKDKLAALQSKVSGLGLDLMVALLPALEKITDAVIAGFNAFTQLPAPVQGLIAGFALLVITLTALSPVIASVITVFEALAALELGAAVAGWIAAAVSGSAGIAAAFGGLLMWIGSTFIPALLAFFSGPVGWTVLAIAAVVALCIAFREPIMKFLTWLGQQLMVGLQALGQLLYAIWVQPWVDLWNNVLRGPVTAIWEWLKGVFRTALAALYSIAWLLFVQPWIDLWEKLLRAPVTKAWTWLKSTWSLIADFFKAKVIIPIQTLWNMLINKIHEAWQKIADFFPKVFDSIANTVKSVFRGILLWIAGKINFVSGLINKLIGAYNRLPAPDIPLIPMMQIPAFAEGGVVDRPTLALTGEAGQREYIIPEGKMAAASSAYLSGARGASVLASTRASAPQITIQTGPVMEFDGQRYVTVEDFQRGAQQIAEGVIGRLRTPSARLALGLS